MGTISCHSNQSSYPTGLKNITFRSPIPIAATVQATKRLYPSRLRTWNFASHVTFLRGFCKEVAWVLRGISVSFAKFREIFFVERGKQA